MKLLACSLEAGRFPVFSAGSAFAKLPRPLGEQVAGEQVAGAGPGGIRGAINTATVSDLAAFQKWWPLWGRGQGRAEFLSVSVGFVLPEDLPSVNSRRNILRLVELP